MHLLFTLTKFNSWPPLPQPQLVGWALDRALCDPLPVGLTNRWPMMHTAPPPQALCQPSPPAQADTEALCQIPPLKLRRGQPGGVPSCPPPPLKLTVSRSSDHSNMLGWSSLKADSDLTALRI